MDIEIRARSGRSVEISPSGDVDLATAPQLRRMLNEFRGDGIDAITIDLDAVTFMDAAGLSPLLEISAEMPVMIRRISPPVRRLIEICELDGWLDGATGTASSTS